MGTLVLKPPIMGSIFYMLSSIKQQFLEGRNLLAFTFLNFMAQAAGALLLLLIAKFFSETQFGSFSLAKMVVFFIVTLTIGASQSAFIVYAGEERRETGKINKSFSIQLIFLLSAVIAGAFLLYFFRDLVSRFAGMASADLVFLFLALVGYLLKFFLCSLFLALDKRMQAATAELTYAALNFVLVILFFVTGYFALNTVLLTFFLSTPLLFLLHFKAVDAELILPFKIDSIYLKKMFDFSKWMFFGSAAAYFINWGDNIVLRLFVPMSEIGIYNLAYQFFKGFLIAAAIINQYFMPFIVTHISDRSKIKKYLFNKRPKIFSAAVIVWLAAFFVLPVCVEAFYGHKYDSASFLFQILSFGVLMVLYMSFYEPLYKALKRYRFITFSTIIQISVNLLLAFALIPFYGIEGAAVATVCAYLCKLVMFEAYYRIHLKQFYTGS